MIQLEVQFEDPNPQKWCHPLKEDVFANFTSKENPTLPKIFGAGSFFNPMLFGKFFDPSDAFPLWEFESDALLPNPQISNVNWFQTDSDYVLKADLPGVGNNTIQVCVVNGEILEINGQWRQQKEASSRTIKDWKSLHWWEYGYVRRIELPQHTNWRKLEAQVKNDLLLEIKIPKILLDGDVQQ